MSWACGRVLLGRVGGNDLNCVFSFVGSFVGGRFDWVDIELMGSGFGFVFGVGLFLLFEGIIKVVFLVEEEGVFMVWEGGLPDHGFVLFFFGFGGVLEGGFFEDGLLGELKFVFLRTIAGSGKVVEFGLTGCSHHLISFFEFIGALAADEFLDFCPDSMMIFEFFCLLFFL